MIRINLDEAIKAGIFENSLPSGSADFVLTLQRENAYHMGFYAGEWEPDEKLHLQSINQV